MTMRRINRLAVGLSPLLLVSVASADQYFDTNGSAAGYGITSGGTYSWEGAYWTDTAGGNSATYNFSGGQATFMADTSTPYTVTVGAVESVTLLYGNNAAAAVTIAQATGTSGGLDISIDGATDYSSVGLGYLQDWRPTASSTGVTANLTVSAPISGGTGINLRGYGTLSLYGDNSYSGGTRFTGGEFINYNNNHSFGTGGLAFNGATDTFTNQSTGAVTLNNNTRLASGAVIALNSGGTVSAPGLTLAGAMTNVGGGTISATSGFTKISGVVTGTGTLNLVGTGTTGFVISTPMANTGRVRIYGGTVALGATNILSSNALVALGNGATLAPGAYNQAMTSTSLNVITGSGSIDFTGGAVEVDFADSSANAWTSGTTLTLIGFDPATDKLRFGTTSAGLTSTQLSQLRLSTNPSAAFALDANGYVTTPEPAALGLLSLGLLAIGRRRRD